MKHVINKRLSKSCYIKKTGGKTYVAVGDSITYGYVSESCNQMKNPYPILVSKALNLKNVINMGVGQSTLANNKSGTNPFVTRYQDIPENADIISIFGGVNDYIFNSPLGDISSIDNATVYGAIREICINIKESHPNAYIFFITPLPKKDGEINNSQGYKVSDVARAIKTICSTYNIDVLDAYSESGFNINENDGLHPTQYFVENSLAPLISNFLKGKK